jgi:chromosome segregation ATPase
MKRLEEELCAMMEAQDAEVEEAKEVARRAQVELEEHREELEALQEERDKLAAALEADHSQADESHSSPAEQGKLIELDAECARLKRSLQGRETRLTHAEGQLETLQQEIASLKKELRDAQNSTEGSDDALHRIQSLKDQAERQLEDTEQELEDCKRQVSALSARLDSAIADTQHIETDLRMQLSVAHKEVDRLQASSRDQYIDRDAKDDLKDLEISNLQRVKAELESRVSSLKKQINLLQMPLEGGPHDTPERSLPFRSILGVPTPKTPGFFKYNVRSTCGSNAPDDFDRPHIAP